MQGDEMLIFELTNHYLNEFSDAEQDEAEDWAKGMVEEINKALEGEGIDCKYYPYEKKRELAWDMIHTMDEAINQLMTRVSQVVGH